MMSDTDLNAWLNEMMPKVRDVVISWRGYIKNNVPPGGVVHPMYADLTNAEIDIMGGLNGLLVKMVGGCADQCACPSCNLAHELRQKLKLEPGKKKEDWKPLS